MRLYTLCYLLWLLPFGLSAQRFEPCKQSSDRLVRNWGGQLAKAFLSENSESFLISGYRAYEDGKIIVLNFQEQIGKEEEPKVTNSCVILRKGKRLRPLPIYFSPTQRDLYSWNALYYKKVKHPYRIPAAWKGFMDFDGDGDKDIVLHFRVEGTVQVRGRYYVAFRQSSSFVAQEFTVAYQQSLLKNCQPWEHRAFRAVDIGGKKILELEEHIKTCSSGKAVEQLRRKTSYQWNIRRRRFEQLHLPNGQATSNIFVYRVQSGDTFWKIAQRFKVSLRELKQLNGKREDFIRVGDQLKIPQKPAFIVHEVVKEDKSLWRIARKYQLSVERLKAYNRKKEDAIFIGEKLLIPLKT